MLLALYPSYAPTFPTAAASVYLTYSDDYGRTWATEALVIADAHYPTASASPFDGTLVVAAVRFVSGSSAPCKIAAKRQGPGDAAMGSEFYFKDDAAADMEFEDDTFHIVPAMDGSARWVMVATAYGDTDVSEWESFDKCSTWTLIG